MVNLNVNPSDALKALILPEMDSGFVIYTNGSIPTTALPDEFIDIRPNGSLSSIASKRGLAEQVLTVSLYRKLLSTGASNSVRENILLGKFQSLFDNPLLSQEFSFHLDKSGIIYQGKNIEEGYSTRVLNVRVFINY
jgi:hypothetical protein